MDFVIPVALGELLADMDILTAAKLHGHRAKALAPPKLQCLDFSRGVRIDGFDWVQRCRFLKMLMIYFGWWKLEARRCNGGRLLGWRE